MVGCSLYAKNLIVEHYIVIKYRSVGTSMNAYSNNVEVSRASFLIVIDCEFSQ